MSELFVGIRFPIRARYVYLLRSGAGAGHSAMLRGSGLLTETTGLITFGLVAAGVHFDVLIGSGVDEPINADIVAISLAPGVTRP